MPASGGRPGRRASRRSFGFAGPVSLAVLFLVGAGLPAAALSYRTTSPVVRHDAQVSVAISAGGGTGFSFDPSSVPIHVGDSLSISITNLGSLAHTFTVVPLANYTVSANNLTTFFQQHPPTVSVNITATPGSVTNVPAFTLPHKGYYEFVCTAQGHLQQGMFGYIGVDAATPNTVIATGPGLPVFIISGTIVALIVVAIVLGFVVGRRRGGLHEMPAERLGYPEPVGGPPPPEAPTGTGPGAGGGRQHP